MLEIARQTVAAIGKEKLGIRFSPYSTSGDLAAYDPAIIQETYVYLARELENIGINYIHIGFSPKIPRRYWTSSVLHLAAPLYYATGLHLKQLRRH